MKTVAATFAFGLALLPLASHAADTDPYPNRPIHMVVGWEPGGGADQVARIVFKAMAKSIGQSIIIDNRPGAGATIAFDYVRRQAPDGYTLTVALAPMYRALKFMYPSIKFDGASDFTPITQLASGPLLIVANKSLGVANLDQFVEKAKQAKNTIFFATSGTGGVPHYAGVAFAQAAGIKLEPVAFKGGGPAVMAVVAGQTQVAFETPPSVVAMVNSGKLQALSVTTKERSPMFPNVPGIGESHVKGYDLPYWIGLFGPAGMPAAVRDKVFDAARRALADPEVQNELKLGGVAAAASASPAEFQAYYKLDGQKTYELVKAAMADRR